MRIRMDGCKIIATNDDGTAREISVTVTDNCVIRNVTVVDSEHWPITLYSDDEWPDEIDTE